MSIIQIKNLTFGYLGTDEIIFSNVNLNLDTEWRLGLIGRNGRGKTTFLNLLLGKLKGEGAITSVENFEYFPVTVIDKEKTALSVARNIIAPFDDWERKMAVLVNNGSDKAIKEYGEIEQLYSEANGYTIDNKIIFELNKLSVHAAVLNRHYESLSGGEQVKIMLAALFLKPHSFLLIDEPTDHLDAGARQIMAKWLATKKGFILVSHDRAFIDLSVDYVLSINRADVELQKGNYSSWRHNRELKDNYEKSENAKFKASINNLEIAAKRTEKWADKIEKSKKNMRVKPKESLVKLDKGYVGHKASKMMQRSKSIIKRQNIEIDKKSKLLKNIEEIETVKLQSLIPIKDRLVVFEHVSFGYNEQMLINYLSFAVEKGDRIAITGANGTGKTSLIKLLLGEVLPTQGEINKSSNLIISTLPQNTDFLIGDIREFAENEKINVSLFLTILRKLNFKRETFEQSMQSFSAGQKKKVCLAASLSKPAHLFLWDEPLNYIDILSREQIQDAILLSEPTMIFVEHDALFLKTIKTKEIKL